MKGNPVDFIIQEQMGMVLINPTNENFDMQYAGVSFTMKPGEKKTFEAKCANHLLNAYGPRGLSYLQYGADEKVVGDAGRERNRAFKLRMVTDFNVRNENRKNMGLGYLTPTEKIKEYADELGLELMEPYAPRDKEKDRMRELEEQNLTFARAMLQLQEEIRELRESKKK